ncbi:MAG: adenylate/guanylate cyclase domain-containing protein [Desulfarculaceae bacterium]|nr:adenylate/guanylate cyclase domain-containing protein [Desulfarculaceae bacterium]MCF8049564.1 adenylate/guanylate cyclase domain-containing protein [Desulfarculaceae bacterium]MCF8066839.1 adenylate/guanylate cyclase domain-containing protein [Desulfarculaceae bacterium]MCF8099902.1 adenylate/guanylate cyclase domain-containing protein [Desulfarculaceae bacterium]
MYQALTRNVSTIMSADVSGFSRLISRNDVGAVLAINQLRHLIARQVEKHHGRVVDMAGDSLLAVFDSALSAVCCGLAMQEELWARNRRLHVAERMCFRLGIDQGSVLHQGERVYGEAVNTAARLQAIAPPGGVIISSAVYRQVLGLLPLEAEYQGETVLKNIPKRVAAYRLFPRIGDCRQEGDCVLEFRSSRGCCD